MNPPTPRVRALLALVFVFVLGGVAGAGVARLAGGRGPHGGPPELRALELTPAQERQARAIGDRHRPELEAIRVEVAPRVRAVRERMRAELRAILTPEQRARLDAIPPDDDPPPGGPPPP
jgi:Spy/CpxP family protein refolding chaperone